MQSQNRIFDDLARVAGGALGALSGVREEIELLVRGRIERVLADMELVPREEFEVVKEMAAQARSENEQLAARVAALEEKLAHGKSRAAVVASAKRRRVVRRGVCLVKRAPKPESTPVEVEVDIEGGDGQ